MFLYSDYRILSDTMRKWKKGHAENLGTPKMLSVRANFDGARSERLVGQLTFYKWAMIFCPVDSCWVIRLTTLGWLPPQFLLAHLYTSQPHSWLVFNVTSFHYLDFIGDGRPYLSLLIYPAEDWGQEACFHDSGWGVSLAMLRELDDAGGRDIRSLREALMLYDFPCHFVSFFLCAVGRSLRCCQYILSTVCQGSASSLAMASHIWALSLVNYISTILVSRVGRIILII